MSGTFASLLLAAVEKEAPLIDIDGTVVVQFGLFLLMAALLYGLVFKPFLRVRDERTRGIEGARTEARSLEERAAQMGTDVEARTAAARRKVEEERVQLRAEAATHEAQALGAARDAAQKAIAEARARAQKERDEARTALLAEAEPLAQKVASRVLGRPL